MDRIWLFNALADARGLPLGSTAATPIRFVEDGRQRHHLPDGRRADARRLLREHRGLPGGVAGQGGLRIALTLHQTPDDIRALIDAIARRL